MPEEKKDNYNSKALAIKMIVGYSLVGIYVLFFILLVASLSST
tara:strand:+ start:3153 stop:3281 length:129 start_codon:yes stop_codon:yes gene_type:complete